MDAASRPIAPVYDDADEYRPEPEPELDPLAWCDGSVRIGIHTSIAGGLTGSLESARKLGCNALQIFSCSPRMWPQPGSRPNEADAQHFRTRRAELALGPFVIHANYLINLAAPEPVLRARSILAFHGELLRAVALGADFLVIHPGSGRRSSPSQAIADIAQSLRQASRGIDFGRAGTGEAFRDLARGGLRILLENTAGMGSAIGSSFEELRQVLDQAPELPLGVCLDTAHAFEAGYPIHTKMGLDDTIAAIDRTVTLDCVAVVHVNDSKTPFGSRVDRHEHIGHGAIGLKAFGRILTHPRLSAMPPAGLPGRAFILETPIDEPGDDCRNIRSLWEAAGVGAKHAPPAMSGFSMLRATRKPALTAATSAAANRKKKRRAPKPGAKRKWRKQGE